MKQIKLTTAIALIVLSIATTFNVTLITSYEIINQKQGEYQQMQKELSKIYEVMQIVSKNYVGEADFENALDSAAAGYIAGIGDRWSYYLSEEDYQEFQADSSKNLVGIGVNVVYDEEQDAILITNVYDNSPASKAGLRKFDYIVAVDENRISEIGYREAVDLVAGEKNTTVELEILRNGINQTFEITRDTVAKVSVNLEMVEDDIAYIQITSFESDTANQFETAVKRATAQGAEGFIFDLRNNPGGYLTKLVECLDIILPEGTIISTVSNTGKEEVHKSDKNYLDMPITVLINSNSYSAAEFFAAAVQEYEVGTVIGEGTSGKGYSQSPVELSDGSAIILSTNKYYTPQGNTLAQVGVTPDIIVELSVEENKKFYYLTSETDPQILTAIDEIQKQIKE